MLPKILTEHDLRRLPLRAMVALSARCARRCQQMYELLEDFQCGESHIQAVEHAIRIAENFASGAVDASMDFAESALRSAQSAASAAQSAASAARSAALSARTAASAAQSAASAARSAALSARTAAQFAALSARTTAWSSAKTFGYATDWSSALSAALSDFEKLCALNLGQFPDLGDSVDPSEVGPLGPFWPNSVPEMRKSQ